MKESIFLSYFFKKAHRKTVSIMSSSQDIGVSVDHSPSAQY